MRRLRAGLCLALCLLTTGLPSGAVELDLGGTSEAPSVRLEIPAVSVLPGASVAPIAQAPLFDLKAVELGAVEQAKLRAGVQTLQLQAQPEAQRQSETALARVETMQRSVAATQKADVVAQVSEGGRQWTGERLSGSRDEIAVPLDSVRERRSFLKPFRRVKTAVVTAAATLLVAAPAFAGGPQAAVNAQPSIHPAVPQPVLDFLHNYGHWVGGVAIAAGTFAAIQAGRYVVDKIADRAKARPTTRAALRLAASVAIGVAGALVGLHAVGVPASELTPSAIFGSLGVSMILKDEISNLIEGAKVMVNQPFKLGDKIQLGAEKYTVTGMDLQYLFLRPESADPKEPWSSDWNKEFMDVAGSSIKVFRPYSTSHKIRPIKTASWTKVVAGVVKAPGMLWRATKEMPRPDLKRASLWLAAGAALLYGVPKAKAAVLAFLPSHLAGVSLALGWASAALALAGVGFVGFRLARAAKRGIDSIAEKRGWRPWVRKTAGVAAVGLIAAGALALLVAGLPVLKALVTVSVATNLAWVAQAVTTIFGYLQAAAILSAARAVHNWLRGIIERLAARFGWNAHFTQILKLILDVLSLAVGGSLALRAIGMTGMGLIKTFAIGSSALTIGGSDILKNLVRGLKLLVRRPFEIGDMLMVDGYIGKVEDITVQYVVLSQDDGASHVLVPQEVMKKGFLPLRTPEDVERAKKAKKEAADQAEFLAELFRKSKAK